MIIAFCHLKIEITAFFATLKLDRKIRVHLAMFSVALFYAANYSIAKWAMPEFISPFAFITLRVGCGALFFGAYYFLFSREKIIDTRDYLDFAVCAFFGVALNMLAFFKGLSMTSAINASVLMLLSPIMVVLYTAIGTKSRIKSRVILGILISFIGAALLVNAGSFSLSSDGLHGDLLILLNACSFAFHLYYVARLLKKYKAYYGYCLYVYDWFYVCATSRFLRVHSCAVAPIYCSSRIRLSLCGDFRNSA